MSITTFGFGVRVSFAYHYLEVDGERLEVFVKPKLSSVLEVAYFENGFVVFHANYEMRSMEISTKSLRWRVA